eukprot:2213980-Pyramimonas_sp.AAC.1
MIERAGGRRAVSRRPPAAPVLPPFPCNCFFLRRGSRSCICALAIPPARLSPPAGPLARSLDRWVKQRPRQKVRFRALRAVGPLGAVEHRGSRLSSSSSRPGRRSDRRLRRADQLGLIRRARPHARARATGRKKPAQLGSAAALDVGDADEETGGNVVSGTFAKSRSSAVPGAAACAGDSEFESDNARLTKCLADTRNRMPRLFCKTELDAAANQEAVKHERRLGCFLGRMREFQKSCSGETTREMCDFYAILGLKGSQLTAK